MVENPQKTLAVGLFAHQKAPASFKWKETFILEIHSHVPLFLINSYFIMTFDQQLGIDNLHPENGGNSKGIPSPKCTEQILDFQDNLRFFYPFVAKTEKICEWQSWWRPLHDVIMELEDDQNKFADGCLVGGFNPSEKYLSKWESSPNRGEHKTYCIWNHHLASWMQRIYGLCFTV